MAASRQTRVAVAMLAAVAFLTAPPSLSPGISHEPRAEATYGSYPLGARDLSLGDQGSDVKTLNWALRSQALSTGHHGTFDGQTDWAVRTLQSGAGLRADGIVRRETRKAIAARMLNQRATWYGPGFYGNRTACDIELTKATVGVAHRTLPCGTRVTFAHRGRWLRAKVIDRGPYRSGHRWDLTRPLAKGLGVIAAGSARIKVGVAP